MSLRPWHKRYHSDALSGFIVLSLEERGAYQTLLDLIYDRGGPMPDNDAVLARYMGVTIRHWRKLRDSLIKNGKIEVDADGNLTNRRAIEEIENGKKTSEIRSKNGKKTQEKNQKSREKHNEINYGDDNLLLYARALPEARSQNNMEPTVLANSRSQNEQGGIGEDIPAKPKVSSSVIDEALEKWASAASHRGWPIPRKLTDQRKRKLAARLKTHGLDGLREALVKAYRSPLLSASPPPTWFTLDWITKNDENLLKVLEGHYDRGFGEQGVAAPVAIDRHRTPEELAAARQRLIERGEIAG